MTNESTITAETEASEVEPRIQALAAFLEIEADDISEASYDENSYKAEGAEYLVLTDSEADDRAKEYILDSLWAFNASFLSEYTDLPEEVFTAMQDKCEGANGTFKALVSRADGGIDGFVEQAVSADGRGHFMSSYDGEENEETADGERFFIYRTN